MFLKKKMAWFPNAMLFNLCKLIPGRNKKLWIFAASNGNSYDGNSKYLFEYVVKNHSEKVKCIWLSSNKKIVERVSSLGYESYLSNSLSGIWCQIRAGISFNTHGFTDFSLFPLLGGIFNVYLCHGMSLKKTNNARYHGFTKFLKNIANNIFSWTGNNLLCTSSQFCINQSSEIIGKEAMKNGRITGFPRNDAFKCDLDKKIILSRSDIDDTKKIVLYMPTYRHSKLGKDAMKNILENLYNSQFLDNVLNNNNCIFVAKLHPTTPYISMTNRNNFHIVNSEEIESTQDLMGVSDIIITDYSSSCVDFALLDRPVIFYEPDREDFLNYSEPIYDEVSEIINLNTSNTPEQLAERIANPSMVATKALNDLFEDESIRGTCYSENVYNAIIKEIGL